MKGITRASRRSASRAAGLLLLIIFSAILLVQSVACRAPLNEPPDSDLQEYEVSDDVRALALQIAARLFETNSSVSEFARELLESHLQTTGKDFAIIYNTGGFGAASVADDPEWGGVVHGIALEMAELGYSATLLEHIRGQYGLRGFLEESWDIARNYAGKAPVLAAKIEFLTAVEDSLNIIITGRSFGAIFSSEAMNHLEVNQRVFSIQAGHPFWYRPPPHPNTLMIEDNGLMPDSLSQGDLWTILWANLSHCPSTTRPTGGSMKLGPFFFRAPGHEYTWDHAGVRDRIMPFLEENFAIVDSIMAPDTPPITVVSSSLIGGLSRQDIDGSETAGEVIFTPAADNP